MNRISTVIACVFALVVPTGASAQVAAPVLSELPASTEALGLGGVFPVSGQDSDAVFSNAAVLAGARGVSLGLQSLGNGSRLLSASGAVAWLDGGVGIGVQALTYDAADGVPPTLADLVDDGDVAVSELAASVGYGREVGGVRVGLTAKILEQRIGGDSGTGGALDVAAALDLSFLTLGVAVQNLGPVLEVGEQELSMPDRVTLAGSFEPEAVGPLDLRAVAAVSRRTDGELIPAGGVDVRFWPVQGRTFIARLGASRVPEGAARSWTAGLAFWGDAIAVEYAFRPYEGTSDSHRFGLRWRR